MIRIQISSTSKRLVLLMKSSKQLIRWLTFEYNTTLNNHLLPSANELANFPQFSTVKYMCSNTVSKFTVPLKVIRLRCKSDNAEHSLYLKYIYHGRTNPTIRCATVELSASRSFRVITINNSNQGPDEENFSWPVNFRDCLRQIKRTASETNIFVSKLGMNYFLSPWPNPTRRFYPQGSIRRFCIRK